MQPVWKQFVGLRKRNGPDDCYPLLPNESRRSKVKVPGAGVQYKRAFPTSKSREISFRCVSMYGKYVLLEILLEKQHMGVENE